MDLDAIEKFAIIGKDDKISFKWKMFTFVRYAFSFFCLISTFLIFFGFDKMLLAPMWKTSENIAKYKSPAGFDLDYYNISVPNKFNNKENLRGWFIYKNSTAKNPDFIRIF